MGEDELTNTDFDLAKGDLVSNLVDGSETGRALSVQTVTAGRVGDASPERTHTSLCGASTWGEDGTDGDILDELGVDLGLSNDTLQGPAEHLLGGALREAALLGLGDGRSQGRDNDDWWITKQSKQFKKVRTDK